MAQPEFHRPECFDGSTTDEIHERMMASLPDGHVQKDALSALQESLYLH